MFPDHMRVVTVAEAVDNETPVEGEVLEFKSKGKKKDRVLLFKIDDEEFTVPKKPGMGTVMRYLNVARKSGNDLFAAQALVEEMLGEEKWNAFLEWEDLDDEIMGQVIEKCINIAVASVEATKGK
jgi:hypothetical protein